MIMRGDHNNNFLMIQNEALRDARLSLEARGLLAYMLTMQDDWQFSVEGLAAQTGTGRHTIMRILKELQSAGYLSIKKETNERGQFTGKAWTLHEVPEPVVRKTEVREPVLRENRSRKNRSTEKRTIKNNQYKEDQVLRIPNEEVPSGELLSIGTATKKFTPPTLEEVRAYCQERQNSVDPERWLNYYTSNGWRVGKNPMKDWKAAVRTWERSGYNNPPRNASTSARNTEANKMDEALRIAMQRAEGGAV